MSKVTINSGAQDKIIKAYAEHVMDRKAATYHPILLLKGNQQQELILL